MLFPPDSLPAGPTLPVKRELSLSIASYWDVSSAHIYMLQIKF